MAILQLSLPDSLKAAVEIQAAAAGCESVDDYIAGLIEADKLPPCIEPLNVGQLLKEMDATISAIKAAKPT